MSGPTSRKVIGEPEVARTAGELMEVLASMMDDGKVPVLLPAEDETLIVSLVSDHGQVAIEVEPDTPETMVRHQLAAAEYAQAAGETDLEARIEYLTGELRAMRQRSVRVGDMIETLSGVVPYRFGQVVRGSGDAVVVEVDAEDTEVPGEVTVPRDQIGRIWREVKA